MAVLTGYLGTYYSPQSPGIFRFTVDDQTGSLSPAAVFAPVPNAKYLALQGGVLAAPIQSEAGSGLALIDTKSTDNSIKTTLSEQSGGCYVAYLNGCIYSANFHEGTVSVYDTAAPARLTARYSLGAEAGCHQVLSRGSQLLVPCMEQDRIALFENGVPAGEIPFPKGAGPRHGVFDRAGTRFFVVAEKECALYAFRVLADGVYEPAGKTALLPPEERAGSTAAAIRFSADERFLYVSVRGANRIAVLFVTGTITEVIQLLSSGGDHPRDILLTPNGRFLLSANRFSGNLTVFPVDPQSGRVSSACGQIAAPEAVSIVLSPEPTQQEVFSHGTI